MDIISTHHCKVQYAQYNINLGSTTKLQIVCTLTPLGMFVIIIYCSGIPLYYKTISTTSLAKLASDIRIVYCKKLMLACTRAMMAGAVDDCFPSLPPAKRKKLFSGSGGSDPETVEELISTGEQWGRGVGYVDCIRIYINS